MSEKPYIPMSRVYDSVAEDFAGNPGYCPTPCDVRCAVNDRLDAYSKEGYNVNHGYSQTMAYKQVVKRLKEMRYAGRTHT